MSGLIVYKQMLNDAKSSTLFILQKLISSVVTSVLVHQVEAYLGHATTCWAAQTDPNCPRSSHLLYCLKPSASFCPQDS